MANKFLGQPVDIHGGGSDLVFPHHESEIAQAEGAGEVKPFSRFWLHVAMVRYQGEKMSKSLGNLIMVRDLLNAGYSADAIRILMIRNHYRKPWTYHVSDLDESVEISRGLNEAVGMASGGGPSLDVASYDAKFTEAMEDDLNTPVALKSLLQLSNEISSASARAMNVIEAQRILKNLAKSLGLRLLKDGPEKRVVDGWSIHQRQFEI
jgi:cysteinyl-tRNA synthetase